MSCEGWKEVKLGDVIQFNPKLSLKKGTLYKKVTMQDLIPFERKISGWSKEKFTGGARFENGDTLLARITPCLENGKTAFVDILEQGEIGFGSTEFIVMRPKENITNEKFVYYLAISPNFRSVAIQSMTGSSGRQRVQLDLLKDTLFPIPPLEEQKEIVRILSSIDDKIELNHQINQDLEEMAQAIFKSWFVDFEPFRDGEFVDSELGPIPKGWRVVKLEEVIDIYDSKRIPLSKKQRKECAGIFPYYGATGIIDYVDDYLFDGIYILLGEDGSVINDKDRPFVQYVWGRFWVNNHAHVLKGKSHVTDELLYTFLKQVNIKPYITGAVQLKLNQKNMKKVPFLLPAVNVLDEIGEKFSSIFDLIRKNNEENIILSNLRDTLLPKLMSGEIRV